VSRTVRTLPRLLTILEVAEYLSVSRRSVEVWMHEGRIPVVRVGPRSRRVAEDDLLAFVQTAREVS